MIQKNLMRIATIDLGTNSVRFDIHQLRRGFPPLRLHREKLMIKLGENVFLNGHLDPKAEKRALEAFKHFKEIIDDLGVDNTLAFGTSALRDARDARQFTERVKYITGISIHIISGQEEARLIALGLLSSGTVDATGTFALVDIGGGSTEISLCRGRKLLYSQSYPLGTARLQQVFLKTSPPSREKLEEMRAYIAHTLKAPTPSERWPKLSKIIGSSGTIRALAKILKKSGDADEIERKHLRNLNEKIAKMKRTELLKISGMEPKRVDMILGGAILFEECMNVLGVKRAQSTELSLRDGLLKETETLFHKAAPSRLALHIGEVAQIAARFHIKPIIIKRSQFLADTLFDRLGARIGLKPEWKPYFITAALLRQCGKIISPLQYESASYFIVSSIDLPTNENWEQDFLAWLCLYHRETESMPAPGPLKKDGKKLKAFQKTLGLLILLDILEDGATVSRPHFTLSLKRKSLHLRLKDSHFSGLESALFEARAKIIFKCLGLHSWADYR